MTATTTVAITGDATGISANAGPLDMTAVRAGKPVWAGAAGLRPYRTLHVVDLEWLANAGGVPTIGREDQAWPPDRLLRWAWADYVRTVGIQRGDHALLGMRSGRCGDLADLLTTSGAQLRVASHASGVHAELAESVDVRHAARRFAWLVIPSGSDRLGALAADGIACGMRVWHVGYASPAASPAGTPSIRWTRLLRVRAAA